LASKRGVKALRGVSAIAPAARLRLPTSIATKAACKICLTKIVLLVGMLLPSAANG
jgi:hypothetical protein